MATDPMQEFFDAEWEAGRFTRPSNALNSLIQNPQSFLRKNPIVNTFDCAAHGQTTAYIRNDNTNAKRTGKVLGRLRYHKAESFNIEQSSGANSYGHTFNVHGVFTGPSNVAPVWYTLGNTGPSVMLTAKLTGCTFVARAGAAAHEVDVTHLQPTAESGRTLNRRLRGGGRAAYGRLKYDYAKRSINVIGVRHNGHWRIWVQRLVKNSHEPRVLGVKRIWPT